MADEKIDSQHEAALEKNEKNSGNSDSKSLKYAYEMILNYGYQEHKTICIDRQRIQFDYIKLYATLASIIIGAIISAASFFDLKEHIIQPKDIMQSLYFMVLIVSIGICLYVFLISISLLRGKSKTPFPFGGISKTYEWIHDIAVRLRVKKKVQNLNAMWYKEFAKNFATQGDFGHESP